MHRHAKSPAMSYLVIDTSKTVASYEPEPDTWSIAKVAHDKLVSEAAYPDHDLRKIVAHATLYDRLLDEYYSSSRPSSPPPSPPMPQKLAFEPTPEEKPVVVSMKEDAHDTAIVEHEEGLGLVKVASHSDNMTTCTEIAVQEVEVGDDD
ncbi:uncharacterized protein PAC_11497 [Phialocephala subalpina]|uniref:Uncharacterized protein n=1 Tax=Phialocephala subalpina TaxID=576137 RepID=A0A1L7X9A6_9HELO|nr:uncharacterized protein PAC_11497 [Phialocephala subalpina]